MKAAFRFLLFVVAASGADLDIRDLFARARLLAERNQNLPEAVRLYSQVVQLARTQHALAARAQYEQGLLYQRMGRTDQAQRAFRAVLHDFPDQRSVVDLARAKLPPGSVEIAIRQVWTGDDVDANGRVSRDGRLLSFTDWSTGDVAIRTLDTGAMRRVTHKGKTWAESPACAKWSVVSPDARHLLYSWWNDSRVMELRVIASDGSGMRTLYTNEDKSKLLIAADWSPDGRQVLAILGSFNGPQELLLIRVADRSMRRIPCAGRFRGDGMALFSPDGKYIAYDVMVQGANVDLRLLDLATQRDTGIAEHPAEDALLGWAPDGSGLVFRSGRSGESGIWLIRVSAGQAQGEPVLVRSSIGWFASNGITHNGSLFYHSTQNSSEIYIAEIDPVSAAVTMPPRPLTTNFVGTKRPHAWSPDGSALMYSATPAGANTLIIRTLSNGSERTISPSVEGFNQVLAWHPDGHSVFAMGATLEGVSGILQVDLDTLKSTVIATGIQDRPGFSADAARMYFMRDMQDLIERNLENGAERVVYHTDIAGGLKNPHASISPDSKRILFQLMNPARQTNSLAVIPVEGGAPSILFSIPDSEQFGANSLIWTGDERQILFARTANDRSTVWKIPAEGGQPQPLGIEMRGAIRRLRLSPDGRRLAFITIEMKDEIWTIENLFPPMLAR